MKRLLVHLWFAACSGIENLASQRYQALSKDNSNNAGSVDSLAPSSRCASIGVQRSCSTLELNLLFFKKTWWQERVEYFCTGARLSDRGCRPRWQRRFLTVVRWLFISWLSNATFEIIRNSLSFLP